MVDVVRRFLQKGGGRCHIDYTRFLRSKPPTKYTPDTILPTKHRLTLHIGLKLQTHNKHVVLPSTLYEIHRLVYMVYS